jgi:hypothetical protein
MPRRATDPEMPRWLEPVASGVHISGACAVQLQFGTDRINLGEIATGEADNA